MPLGSFETFFLRWAASNVRVARARAAGTCIPPGHAETACPLSGFTRVLRCREKRVKNRETRCESQRKNKTNGRREKGAFCLKERHCYSVLNRHGMAFTASVCFAEDFTTLFTVFHVYSCFARLPGYCSFKHREACENRGNRENRCEKPTGKQTKTVKTVPPV